MSRYSAKALERVIDIDSQKCRGCDYCRGVCPNNAIQGKRGEKHTIDSSKCLFCGQCLVNCRFGAPRDIVDNVDLVLQRIKQQPGSVFSLIAPSVRVAIGEEFGMEAGTVVTKKLYEALRLAGFKLTDVTFAADQTVIEESNELVARIRMNLKNRSHRNNRGSHLPQFTSCCPAWVRYVELNYPKLLPYVSSAKSPLMMVGALAKTYGSKFVWSSDPARMYLTALMPCTAKKYEVSRPEYQSAANYWQKQGHSDRYPDVDCVLTTRELALLFKKMNIDVSKIPDSTSQDNPLTSYSGAGVIFGNTGGVMEAAIRTVHYLLSGKELGSVEFTPVRGLKEFKEASITIPDAQTGTAISLKVAVVYGLKNNINQLITQALNGNSPYQFIEVMACPGGCVNGGGQPINPMDASLHGMYKAVVSRS